MYNVQFPAHIGNAIVADQLNFIIQKFIEINIIRIVI